MRLALIILLTLATSGCALLRKDKEEPVENTPPPVKRKTQERPSDVMRRDKAVVASPVSDHFAFRLTAFLPSVATDLKLDSTGGARQGTLLSGEDDLGLDDAIEQVRGEATIRLKKWHQLRFDFFKLSRFAQQPLPRPIRFGDLTTGGATVLPQGTMFRTKLDWRVFSMTHTISILRHERVEAGMGLGFHIIQARAEGGIPGTTQRENVSEAGIFPTLAISGAWRISKRFSLSLRGQYLSAAPEGFDGTVSDYHGDVQFRWKKNLSVGLGYSKLSTELQVIDADLPLLFNMDVSGPELFVRAAF